MKLKKRRRHRTPDTPYRVLRLGGGGWVAWHAYRGIYHWVSHSVDVTVRERGRELDVRGVKGRTPFEALFRLKTALRLSA